MFVQRHHFDLILALARRSKFSDTARNPAKQRSISSAVLRSLMSVGNATDKADWRRTYGQIPLFVARRSKFSDTARNPAKQRSISSAVLRSLMSVGNATDKAEWRRTYRQIPLFARPPWSICTSGFYVSLENFIGFWTKSSREVGLPYMEPRRRLDRHIWLVMNYSCL